MVILVLRQPELAQVVDPVGVINVVSDFAQNWTPAEKGTRLPKLEGALLMNRLVWIGIAVLTLVLTHFRFRFLHPTASTFWQRIKKNKPVTPDASEQSPLMDSAILAPQVRQIFGFRSRVRQTLAITWSSFGQLARGWTGIFLLVVIALLTVLIVPLQMENMNVPLMPRTGYLLSFLTNPLNRALTVWLVIPLLIMAYVGELVWRERDARLSEITSVTPVPEWALFLGKFLGLLLMLVVWTALLALAGLLVQKSMGFEGGDHGLLFTVLFGLQLPEYILFAMLAFVVHILVNNKAIGHLVILMLFAFISFAPRLGVEHQLLIYGAAPGWAYSEMRGFGWSLQPWIWFKLYWAGWALMLAVLGRLFWVRAKEGNFQARLRLARQRLTPGTIGVASIALTLIIALGGFIFYNTNVLNVYLSSDDLTERSARYEQQFSKYSAIPQPELTATKLQVEIYPRQRKVEIQGTYLLVNQSARAIGSVHITTIPSVETRTLGLDRQNNRLVTDSKLGYHIFALKKPLQQGDSLKLSFEVLVESQGFTNKGINPSVLPNGTNFTNEDYLPAIGYQSSRELVNPGDRVRYGLNPRPPVPPLDENDSRRIMLAGKRIKFEAIIGTDEDQTAIAPGALRNTWTTDSAGVKRRYFEYSSNEPIPNLIGILSADYSVLEGTWKDPRTGKPVLIQVFHHPTHTLNIKRIFESVEASLDYHTRQYGPYPYRQIRIIEQAGRMMGMHSEPSQITYGEGFSMMDLTKDPRSLDLPFAVTAHEMGHQWWGGQLKPARIAGAPLLSESLAWYSAMGVILETDGEEHLDRLLNMMRQPYPIAPIKPSVPLIQAADRYQAYRKGPFALLTLTKYMGRERVDAALRNTLKQHQASAPRLATSLDLYSELRAIAPDSLQSLVDELFKENTFWELKAEKSAAHQLQGGKWQVVLEINARKLTLAASGKETEKRMNDWLEIGVFAPSTDGKPGKRLYLQKHRIRSGKQTITLIVPEQPGRAGIDPNHLMVDWKPQDNMRKVKIGA